MCSITRLAFVLALAIASSTEVAESRDFNILAQGSLPDAAKGLGLTASSGKLCQLCEQYSTEALFYLTQNETRTEILSILHHECASLAPLKQQCITLVDYYVPLFFLELEVIDLLTKTCSKAQNYEQQCKRLVLKYTPLILVKGQKFLETTDVCSAIHACKAGTQASMEAMPLSATL
ncbi:unnamed protein product [Miscanthus lutarioriparius]|uniref:Saposin B-type domain-containing protein n=1 Tax=Miscanthus lutarioriparius TaxID=422564 RepID=A0A811P693_9POAL|nr:unnamed protein product [Miscanthus lutarioriparius]